MTVTLRAARAEDAAACGRICYEAFTTIAEQHRFPPDFPSAAAATELLASIMPAPGVYAVVAEIEGRVVGSNFLWENDPVAGVGPITIDPSAQNSQVGRLLMTRVLERAAEHRKAGVRLVQAAYHNRSLCLYTKLGFDTREPLSLMQGVAIRQQVAGYEVRVARVEDLEACGRLSVRIHGHDRNQELLGAIRQGTATVVEHDGRISGYATAIGFFGHAVAESNEELKALIGAAPAYSGPGFLLPTRNSELFRWCLENGLRVVQPMTLMSLGLYNEPAGVFLPSILF